MQTNPFKREKNIGIPLWTAAVIILSPCIGNSIFSFSSFKPANRTSSEPFVSFDLCKSYTNKIPNFTIQIHLEYGLVFIDVRRISRHCEFHSNDIVNRIARIEGAVLYLAVIRYCKWLILFGDCDQCIKDLWCMREIESRCENNDLWVNCLHVNKFYFDASGIYAFN